MQSLDHPACRRFTLIELLVVVAIIGVLASMLLPALSEARERSRQSACLNNQKQYSLGMFIFESDMERLPNFKASHGMSATLEGQPVDNSVHSSAAVTNNYTGHEDYARYLLEYVGANLKVHNHKHSYIVDWTSNPVVKCPSSSHNELASRVSSISTGGYNDWYRYGAMRTFYVPTGMNFLYFVNNTHNWVGIRRSDRCEDATKVSMVSEPFFINGSTAAGNNNHQNRGHNAVAMDGSARWRSLGEMRGGLDSGFSFGNRFGDTGQGLPFVARDLGLVSIFMRVYTADGVYTNHLPSVQYQAQRDAIKRRIGKLGFGYWEGN